MQPRCRQDVRLEAALGLVKLGLVGLGLVGLGLVGLGLVGLGLVERGLVELGLVERGLVGPGLVEMLGLIGMVARRGDARRGGVLGLGGGDRISI